MNKYFVSMEMPVSAESLFKDVVVTLEVKAETIAKACELTEKEFSGARITECYEIDEDG